MNNTVIKYSNQQSISAVSGSLQKSHSKSHFKAFHINSAMASSYLDDGSGWVVLQIMNTHNEWVIVEAVSKRDYETFPDRGD
jgi:hypothetical protein